MSGDDFHLDAALGKDDRGNAVAEQILADSFHFVYYAAANAKLAVDDRRIVEYKMSLAHGCAIFGNGWQWWRCTE